MFKLCIFGDGGVGKTTLVNRYLTGVFKTGTTMTLGVDFHVKTIVIDEVTVGLQIWDFAGEEQFRYLLPRYTMGASGGIFMFDVTRYMSLNNLSDWLDVFKEGLEGAEKNIPFLMVGGKTDLEDNRSVPKEEAMKIAELNNFSSYIECSSKTSQNVEEIFLKISRLMLEKANLL